MGQCHLSHPRPSHFSRTMLKSWKQLRDKAEVLQLLLYSKLESLLIGASLSEPVQNLMCMKYIIGASLSEPHINGTNV